VVPKLHAVTTFVRYVEDFVVSKVHTVDVMETASGTFSFEGFPASCRVVFEMKVPVAVLAVWI
jgi:hypothetical protein